MLGKRTRPTIGKLAESLVSRVIDDMTRPKGLLECKMHFSRTLKMYDQSGLGLGLILALDKPTNTTSDYKGKILAKYAICGQFPTRSNPIWISPSDRNDKKECKTNSVGKLSGQVMLEMKLQGLDEELTYVTCHGPNKCTTTRVYYDGGEFGKCSQNSGEVKVSPVGFSGDRNDLLPELETDFLSSCHLCRKTLHGKDIYMYRGEKAFCSTECRQKQIAMDERQEKRKSPTDYLATSPCNYSGRSQIFFSAGIVAV